MRLPIISPIENNEPTNGSSDTDIEPVVKGWICADRCKTVVGGSQPIVLPWQNVKIFTKQKNLERNYLTIYV